MLETFEVPSATKCFVFCVQTRKMTKICALSYQQVGKKFIASTISLHYFVCAGKSNEVPNYFSSFSLYAKFYFDIEDYLLLIGVSVSSAYRLYHQRNA